MRARRIAMTLGIAVVAGAGPVAVAAAPGLVPGAPVADETEVGGQDAVPGLGPVTLHPVDPALLASSSGHGSRRATRATRIVVTVSEG